MPGPGPGAQTFTQCSGRLEWPTPAGAVQIPTASEAGQVMERTDWLDEGLNPADARFLMVTAITHHRVSSPIWGEHAVRKLHAELADIQRIAGEVIAEHVKSRRVPRNWGVFGAPA